MGDASGGGSSRTRLRLWTRHVGAGQLGPLAMPAPVTVTPTSFSGGSRATANTHDRSQNGVRCLSSPRPTSPSIAQATADVTMAARSAALVASWRADPAAASAAAMSSASASSRHSPPIRLAL